MMQKIMAAINIETNEVFHLNRNCQLIDWIEQILQKQ